MYTLLLIKEFIRPETLCMQIAAQLKFSAAFFHRSLNFVGFPEPNHLRFHHHQHQHYHIKA
jgi:hypothetical protein